MPRQPRLDIPHVLQHVIVRGIERHDIFVDDTDKERFVARLSDILTKSATKCFAWALMSNHFHLLLMPTSVSLTQTMRRLLTGYAVYFNRKYQRSGHLFQNRYKSILCEEEPYFLELIRYIHLNPQRAGLVPDLETLENYQWSGHAVLLVLLGHRTMAGQECDVVLARFGLRDDLIGGGLKRSLRGQEESSERTAYDERILRCGEFVESLTQGDKKRESPSLQLSLAELLKKSVRSQASRQRGYSVPARKELLPAHGP